MNSKYDIMFNDLKMYIGLSKETAVEGFVINRITLKGGRHKLDIKGILTSPFE